MRNKNSQAYLRFAILISVMLFGYFFPGCTNLPVTGGVPNIVVGTVMFGKSGNADVTSPTSISHDSAGHSGCNGRGICDLSAFSSPGATPVSFFLKDTTPMMLVMTFSLTTLGQNQPDQSRYMTDSSHTYQFESNYPLTSSVLAPLNLPPNSVITPTDTTRVSIRNGQVTLAVAFTHGPRP